ncbi:hypothetical protein J6590_097817, partial [Homalodisca vitripennis]
ITVMVPLGGREVRIPTYQQLRTLGLHPKDDRRQDDVTKFNFVLLSQSFSEAFQADGICGVYHKHLEIKDKHR